MAIQILPRQQSFGENIGRTIGTGLGQGLGMLAQHKLHDILQEKETKKQTQFWKSFNIPEHVAHQLAMAPKEYQRDIFERLQGIVGEQQQQQQQDQQQMGYSTPSSYSQPQQQAQPQQQMMQSQQDQQAQPQQLGAYGQSGLTFAGIPLGLSKAQKEDLRKEKEHNFKETKEERLRLIESEKVAVKKLKDYDEFQKLNEKGDLTSSASVAFMKEAGFDIPSLMTPDAEQWEKLNGNQVLKIGNSFKGSITNQEIVQFMKTIPTLLQSPEGRKRLIAMQKLEARADISYAETAREIMAKNRGIPPLDLSEQIAMKVGPKLDRIAVQYRKELAKPIPAGSNKAIIALGHVAGKAIGNLGKGLAGAGAGAFTGGRLAGVPGAIAGGALGGLAGLSGVTGKGISSSLGF